MNLRTGPPRNVNSNGTAIVESCTVVSHGNGELAKICETDRSDSL
jgi:hypothetical protein